MKDEFFTGCDIVVTSEAARVAPRESRVVRVTDLLGLPGIVELGERPATAVLGHVASTDELLVLVELREVGRFTFLDLISRHVVIDWTALPAVARGEGGHGTGVPPSIEGGVGGTPPWGTPRGVPLSHRARAPMKNESGA